jgi:hypothetical protein
MRECAGLLTLMDVIQNARNAQEIVKEMIMQTYVAVIRGRAVMAFRAQDDDDAREIVRERSMRSDLHTLVDADGEPLWDGKSDIAVEEASPEQHAEWEQSRDQAISDGEIDLDAGHNPDDWDVYLIDVASTQEKRA